MAKLDLEWLPVFVEVYKTRSVSRAAPRLGIAQANASIALNKLRLHFDDRLFSRTSRGPAPARAREPDAAHVPGGKHIVVASSGTGHTIVDKVLAKQGLDRQVVLRLASFLGVARFVAQTDLRVVVPRLLGETLALQERIRLLDPPVPLPTYGVKQHRHERFYADAANVWLRKTFAELFGQPDRKRSGRSVRTPAGARHAIA